MDGESKLHKDALKLLRSGQAEKALTLLLELLFHVDAPQNSYDTWVADAERAAARLADPRLAAYLALYRHDASTARELLPRDRFPVELAHALLQGEGREADKLEAAALFEGQKRLVSAARTYASVGHRAAAVRCYRQLLSDGQLGEYEQALTHFQLALALAVQGPSLDSRDELESRRHAVLCQGLLESLADAHEEAGDVERALDCYRLYIRLGQARRSIENIVEGYTSCLRLLKAERRPLDVLRHYEDLARCCAEFDEHHLLAEKCSEAAAYFERTQPDWALSYRRRAAEALLRAYAHNREHDGPMQLGESTLLQAAAAYNATLDFVAVGSTFAALAALSERGSGPHDEARARRYRSLVERYPRSAASVVDEAVASPALPAYAREPQPQPPVWDLDLVEWQAAGDPRDVCLALVGDRGRPQLTRRHALVVLLHAGLAELSQASTSSSAAPGSASSLAASIETRRRIIDGLCGLHCYEALRPLERLWTEAAGSQTPRGLGAAKGAQGAAHSLANPSPEVLTRRAIIQSLPRLPFRRTLSLIERGLADEDLGVYTASVEALSSAYFPEAVSGLLRLYRAASTTHVVEVQRSILRALGKSRDPRARELFEGVARHDIEPLRSDAAGLLHVLAMSEAGSRPG